MDDAGVVERVRQGDTGAFETLLQRYGNAISNYLRRFMPDGDDAEDLFQEVFIKAYLNLARFDAARGSFGAWLFRIAANVSLDELKRRRREAARREKVADEWHTDEGETAHPVEEDQPVRALRTALQSIPDGERQVVLLSFYHDLKFREIAGVLDIPLGTVKSRMRRAMSRLRQKVALNEVGELR